MANKKMYKSYYLVVSKCLCYEYEFFNYDDMLKFLKKHDDISFIIRRVEFIGYKKANLCIYWKG